MLDASALRDWANTAVGDLMTHADEINRLNVFPVADADTGTNMLFTMRSAVAEANSGSAAGDVARVAAALAAGARTGARGNSGVILSQILSGIGDVTASAADRAAGELDQIDEVLFMAALQRGVELVSAAMGGQEVPGTIATVLRTVAEAVRCCVAAGDGLAQAIIAADEAAASALARTPEQLEVLSAAGVVDAGGRGLLVLLDALRATLVGQVPGRAVYEPAPRPVPVATTVEVPALKFEVMYLLEGCDAAGADVLRKELEACGESVALAAPAAFADADGLGGYSVHVHTDDAGAVITAGLAAGRLSRIQISALTAGMAHSGGTTDRAVLALVDGDGAAALFASEGACVLRPDPVAADPTTALNAQQLLRGVVDTGAAQVLVLPNGYIAAEELVAGVSAASGWGIDVVPLPTGAMVQGLAALAVHEPGRPAVDDGYAMARAAAAVRHGSVRLATEHALTWAGACAPGDGLGIAGDEVLIVASDVTQAAIGLLDLLVAAGGELVTVLIGAGIEEDMDGTGAGVAGALQQHVHDKHPGIDLVAYRTGHRGDAVLLGVE